MKTILVTGGAGFIGSHLVDKLIEMGNKVVIIDDLSLGKRENINEKAVFLQASIIDDLEKIFADYKFDAVFHVAALPRVQFSIKEPHKTHDVNVNGTINLLEMCRKYNVSRFIFSSSSSIYGEQKQLPLKEGVKPNPLSPYALHKLIGEDYCRIYHFLYGVKTISLRYFNVYGPRQDPFGDYACLIPKFISKMLAGEKPTIFGDGNQTRDFTYVDDVVMANITASETDNEECFGEVFNIGSGNSLSVNDVTGYIKESLGSDLEPVHGSAVIEPRDTRADITKAQGALGWYPKISFKEGLRRTAEFFNVSVE